MIFCAVSFLIANLGLNTILSWSLPVLSFLYPLAITLIILALAGQLFDNAKIVYQMVTGFTLAAAVIDGLRALPEQTAGALHVQEIIEAAAKILPLSGIGLGWILPAAVGLAIGFMVNQKIRKSGSS